MYISHTHKAPLGGQLTDHASAEKRAMNSLRKSFKWPYGDAIVLFHAFQSNYEKKYFFIKWVAKSDLALSILFFFV